MNNPPYSPVKGMRSNSPLTTVSATVSGSLYANVAVKVTIRSVVSQRVLTPSLPAMISQADNIVSSIRQKSFSE